MLQALTNGDGFWTYQYSGILSVGAYGFPKNEKESNRLAEIWKTQPIADVNYFLPFYYDPW
jgi:hypothetical protein